MLARDKRRTSLSPEAMAEIISNIHIVTEALECIIERPMVAVVKQVPDTCMQRSRVLIGLP